MVNLVPGENASTGLSAATLCSYLVEGEKALGSPSQEDTNPIIEAPLSSSHRHQLQIPSDWGVRVQMYEFYGGHEHLVCNNFIIMKCCYGYIQCKHLQFCVLVIFASHRGQ